jgi:hypothetical protein
MSPIRFSDLDYDRLRAVPIPGRVSRAMPPRLLRQLLYKVCRELDLRLDAPITVIDRKVIRHVRVFRVVEYRVFAAMRSISCQYVDRDSDFLGRRGQNEDLWRPLGRGTWMPWLLADLGVLQAPSNTQPDLFDGERIECLQWLARTVYRLLQREPRFRDLQQRALPAALGLDRGLVDIALRARLISSGPVLAPALYSRVWRHADAFRQVARENPQLLPLLNAYLDEHGLPARVDPVRAMKTHLREQGVSDAGWRYLCRYGTRFLKPVWALSPQVRPFAIAALFLERLQYLRLPPPPPAALLRAWAKHSDLYDLLFLESLWEEDLCAIYRCAIAEAARCRGTPAFAVFAEQFFGLAAWAQLHSFPMGGNRRRATWPGLVRRWEAERRCALAAQPRQVAGWPSLIGTFEMHGHRVDPLTSKRALLLEGDRMHNCIADYAQGAWDNTVRLFSITPLGGRRPVADVALVYQSAEGVWARIEVAGPANGHVSPIICEVADEIARRYNAAQAGLRLVQYPRPTETFDVPEDWRLDEPWRTAAQTSEGFVCLD